MLSWLQLQTIRNRLLNDPYYRLQSVEEIAVAASLGIQIDVNQATVDDWLRLPGLSIHQARSLVQLSHAGVQFYCLEDIAVALSVPLQRLAPLTPILKFCYYDAETSSFPRINPNTATVEALIQIPTMDLALAQAIVENRQLAGAYRNLVDFQKRLSLPGHMTSQLMYYLSF
jgi:DNA uptake protein ComE-like DNA-binding protein